VTNENTEQLVLSDAVRAIQDSVKTETIRVGDKDYVTRQIFLPPREPEGDCLNIHTLTGIVDFLSHDIDRLKLGKVAVHVVAHDRVAVVGDLQGRHSQRNTFLVAVSEKVVGRTFEFGRFYDCETFNIALQSLFADSDDRDAVLRVVGNIKEENVRTTGDDGVTQTVTAKAGIARVENVDVPNPVSLRPFRTFPEILQPSSLFVLRLRQGSNGEMPSCALFEADGGQWKLEAIKEIKGFLAEHIGDVPVIA
jgi:hypothetical protein